MSGLRLFEVECVAPVPRCQCGKPARYVQPAPDLIGITEPFCTEHARDVVGTIAIRENDRARCVKVVCYAEDENAATLLAAHAGYAAGAGVAVRADPVQGCGELREGAAVNEDMISGFTKGFRIYRCGACVTEHGHLPKEER